MKIYSHYRDISVNVHVPIENPVYTVSHNFTRKNTEMQHLKFVSETLSNVVYKITIRDWLADFTDLRADWPRD